MFQFKRWIAMAGLGLAAAQAATAGTFVYVSNIDSGDIRAYRLQTEPKAHLESLGAWPAGKVVMPMAVSPDLKHLYASVRSQPFAISQYDIDPVSGKLNWRGSVPMADSMVYISVDRTGQWLLATSFGGHVNATQKIDREGRLASSQAQVFKSGGVNPHSIVLDQSNRFAYVPQLGTDEIRIHKFDPQSPQPLSEQAEVVKVKALSGPRHIVISSDNKYAYVLTEMTGQVLVYERNIDTGSLTLIQSVASQPDNTTLVPGRPRPPTGGNQVQDFDDSNMIFCAEIKLTPNGQFLFTSERTKSTLSTFKVDTQTGRIERVAITPTEEMPRGFNIDPSGQYLVATGQKSQMVSLYSIHPQTGALNQIERVPGGQGANWVTFVKTSGL